MRSLSSGMLASIAQTITDPVFLIKVDLTSQYVYASTRESITYDGNTYNTLGAKITSLSSQRVQFTIPNFDRSISALAFTGQIQTNECVIYLHYDGEVIGTFSGVLDAPQCGGDYNYVQFSASDLYAPISRWPYERMTAPDFNYMPAVGTVVRMGNTELSLGSR